MLEVFAALHPTQLETFVIVSVGAVLLLSLLSALVGRMKWPGALAVSAFCVVEIGLAFFLLQRAEGLDPSVAHEKKTHYFRTLCGLLLLSLDEDDDLKVTT